MGTDNDDDDDDDFPGKPVHCGVQQSKEGIQLEHFQKKAQTNVRVRVPVSLMVWDPHGPHRSGKC